MNSYEEKIKKGIAAYQHEQDVFLRLLRKRGQFDEREFDKWYRGRDFKRPIKCRLMTGDTFILGIGINGFNYWAEMLDLLQQMIKLKLIKTTTEKNLVVYSLA